MELTHLRYFVNAAKTGSFVKAAQLSNVSPPAISKAIKKLEDELGTELFARTSRATVLTESGEILLAHCRAVFRSINNFHRALEEAQSKVCGELLIGASEVFALHLLPQTTCAFRDSYPHVIPQCYTLTPDLIEQGVVDGELDIGFTAGSRPSKAVACTELGHSSSVVVCAEGHHLFESASATDAQLGSLPFVAVHGDGFPADRGRHVAAATDSLALGIDIAARGTLLGYFPEVAVRGRVAAGTLRVLDTKPLGESLELFAIELKGAPSKPATKLMLDALVDGLGG